VKRASYEDCEFLETTTFFDMNRNEVYEADIVRVTFKGQTFEDIVDYVPDMFGSKRIHPLQSVLSRHGIQGNPEKVQGHKLIKHGVQELEITDFSFDALKEYLSNPENDIEGIVFHHKTDGRMCKIRKSDFGIKRK
jgi:hypothetical protein